MAQQWFRHSYDKKQLRNLDDQAPPPAPRPRPPPPPPAPRHRAPSRRSPGKLSRGHTFREHTLAAESTGLLPSPLQT